MKKPLSERGRLLVAIVLLSAVTMAVYWQVVDHEFVEYDDHEYIYENPHVLTGLNWHNIQWAFTATRAANWHPLTWLSHMLDCQLYQQKPGGHHLGNLFLHLASALLLLIALHRMTGSVWKSAFTAALFAVHPLHVESVAWAAERKDVLSTLFWMLTILAYLRYVARPGWQRYVPLLVSFALGLMAKPMLVTLPFVLLLLDYWPLNRLTVTAGEIPWPLYRRLTLEKLPLFALTVISSIITVVVQRLGGAMEFLEGVPFHTRAINAIVSYAHYILMMFWPRNLAVLYPHPGGQRPPLLLAGALLLLIAISWQAFRLRKRFPYLLMGWAWYLGTLVPVIGLVQVGDQALADRYTYIPLIGLFIIIAWGGPDLLRSWRKRDIALAVAGSAVVLVLAIGAWFQVQKWRNSVTLFRHTLSVTSQNVTMHYGLGVVLLKQNRIEEALEQLETAVAIEPDNVPANINLGIAFARQGRFDQAVSTLTRVLKLEPDSVPALANLGLVRLMEGSSGQAIEHLSRVLEIEPDHVKARHNLGKAYLVERQYDAAIGCFTGVLNQQPDYLPARHDLGIALNKSGRFQEAGVQLIEVVRIDPLNADAFSNLGFAMEMQQKFKTAALHYSRAIQLDPDHPFAGKSLQRVRAMEMNEKPR